MEKRNELPRSLGWIVVVGGVFLLASVFAQKKSPTLAVPGTSQFSEKNRVEYLVGNLPIIISVPHGGSMVPESIPDRSFGTFVTDRNTVPLAREIIAALHDQTGKYPHVIFCHLKRTKLDCNRPLKEAAQGNREAERVWREFHRNIEMAVEQVERKYGSGLYLDFHGQSHPAGLLELGYLINNKRLQIKDADVSALRRISSIRSLPEKEPRSFAEILRGKTSFGGLMQMRGYPSIPSPDHPNAGKGRYFSGGPNTRRYCLRQEGKLYGFQVECPFKNVRDSESHRKKFATAFADALVQYMQIHTELPL